MLRIFKNIGLILIFFIAFGCGEDLTQFNINSNLSEEIAVNISEEEQTIEYSASIDATEDSDILQNLDHIKSYQIEQISFSITDYSGPDTANLTGTLSVGNANQSFSADIQSLNIKLFADADYTIALDADQLVALESILLASNKLDISFTGSVSEVPVSFVLTVTAKTKVTVDAA